MPADFESRVLLRGEHTGGEISVIENTVPGKWGGPPLHTHEFDETFYVLGGELTFQLEETLTSAAGGEISSPRAESPIPSPTKAMPTPAISSSAHLPASSATSRGSRPSGPASSPPRGHSSRSPK